MRFPVKSKIEDLEVIVGDTPEYAFYVDLIFNTTGNKAYTSIWTMKGENLLKLTDTTEMGYVPEKISKLTPADKQKIHKALYHEWVSSQPNHLLRGTASGKKYGI